MKKIKYFLLTKSVGLGLNMVSYIRPKKASTLAYRLFSEPRTGKLSTENLPLVLQNVPTYDLMIEGYPIKTYVWKGNENIILLVHGWESNTARWERLLPYLQKTGSTIVAVDAPAHGLSGGTEFNMVKYASFIDVVVQNYQPHILIGHSIGAAASIYYQSHYKNDCIEKMVILGAPSDLKTLIGNYVKLLSLNTKMNQLLETFFSEKFKMNVDVFSSSVFAKKIKISGLIVHDIHDEIVAFEEGKKIATSWKNSVFIQTQGLGHSLHDATLYEQIVTFLNT